MLLRTSKKMRVQAIGAAFALLSCAVGCGMNTASSNAQGNRTCGKSTSVSNKNANTAKTSSLNLSGTLETSAQAADGTGFIDITTTDKAGKKLSRRCTMSIRPIDGSDTVVRLWTAGHCPYDPNTAEFLNSKYSLQIFLDGGYFSVPVVFNDFEALQKFGSAFAAMFGDTSDTSGVETNSPVALLKNQIESALPRTNTKVCEEAEKKFKATLGSKAKNIACFSRNELRGMKSTITVDKTTEPLLKRVMTQIREREKAVFAKMDLGFKKLVDAYLAAHTSELRRTAELRSMAYMVNKKFCAAPAAERPLADNSNQPDSDYACKIRSLLLPAIESALPSADYNFAKSFFDDESTDLVTLRKRTMGCNDLSIENFSIDQDVFALTPCDMGNIANTFWRRYVDRGPQLPTSITSQAIFGLSSRNYFGFYTNSIATVAGAKSRARVFSLNSTSVLNFEYLARMNTGTTAKDDTFLINYDAAKEQLNPVKGASGSILSIYGVIPAGLLSTVDGEGTSGGSSITPLPQVGDDDDVPTPRTNSGC